MKRQNELDKNRSPLPRALTELYLQKRTEMVGFTVPYDTARRIENVAKLQGFTKSEWCARAVSEALDAARK